MKFSEKKESDSEANVFLHNGILRRKISNSQFLNWEFFVPADFENKNFQINIFWRRNVFQKLRFWVQFLLRNQISIKNSHLKKKRSDSICSTENNNYFTFRAYFKRHDLKQAFPLKISVWKEILWRKDSDYEAYFFLKNETLNWKFFNMSDFELRIYRPGRYRKQNFLNNHFLEKIYFPETQVFEFNFYSAIRFRSKIHIWKKNILTQFLTGKTANFSLFVLILKSMILKPAFSLKIRVWNGIFWNKIRILKWSFFLQNDQFLNREFFVLADFEKKFPNNRFVEREFFSEI